MRGVHPFLLLLTLLAGIGRLAAAPFEKTISFVQPGGTTVQLWGKGDEFSAVFETLDGYTVVFDRTLRAYCYARLGADGSLNSTGVQVQASSGQSLGLARHLRADAALVKAEAQGRYAKWNLGMDVVRRWQDLKASQRNPEPPTHTTVGNKMGLTLLIDFSDDPSTISQAEIINFANGDTYTGYGNNGSVKKYFQDVSNNKLTYSNVVTIYIRMAQPKSVYNNITNDCGEQANLLIKDALDIMKALPNYATEILPTFDPVTVDANNEVVAFNVFYAGGDGGAWSYGLWPHSGSLRYAGAQELSAGGKKVMRYQITNIGEQLTLGTFCHENGHMLCGFPDIYDYTYTSMGGAGIFCLMDYGGEGGNPVQVCAYLKNAAGWATITDVSPTSTTDAKVNANPGTNFNHFYRYVKPGVPTEYFLIEARNQAARDAGIPASGVAIWHIDEMGDKDISSLVPNNNHQNYEVTLVQADNQWHFEYNVNSGDPMDLYYLGNPAAAYSNEFSDRSTPQAHWWDGTPSGITFWDFSAAGPQMTFSAGTPGLAIDKVVVGGGNGDAMIDPNECTGVYIWLRNGGTRTIQGITGRLTTSTPNVAVTQPDASYLDIPGGTNGVNLTAFKVSTGPNFQCGDPIDFKLFVKSDQMYVTNTFTLGTGKVGNMLRFDNNVTVDIPDGDTNGVDSGILVTNLPGTVRKVVVSAYITHSWDSDLTLELVGPDGTRTKLSSRNGSNGDNYGANCSPDNLRTTFDDAATLAITNGNAPFVGVFTPQEPLAVFAGKRNDTANGVWKLHVSDSMRNNSGAIQCWSLQIWPTQCAAGSGPCPGVDLAIGMNSAPDPVVLGSNMVYTIMVTNNSIGPAHNALVTHALPSSVTYVSAQSSQGNCIFSGGNVTCSLGNLPPGAVATTWVTVAPTNTGLMTSTANVISSDPEIDSFNNSVSLTSRVVPAASDLTVAILDTPDPVNAGGSLRYDVTVVNNGPATATGVVLSNSIPVEMQVNSVVVSQGSSTPPGNIVLCNLGSMAVGASASVQIYTTPLTNGSYTAVTSASSHQADPVPANNTASTRTQVAPAADLSMSLRAVPTAVVTGAEMEYRMVAYNAGPNDVPMAWANLTLPDGARVTRTIPDGMTQTPTLVTWNIGVLLCGNSVTGSVFVIYAAPQTNVNTATILSSGIAELVSTNDSSSVTVRVGAAKPEPVLIGVDLTGESGPINGSLDRGERVTVAFRLRNIGNTATTNLMTALLPGGGVQNPTGAVTNGVLVADIGLGLATFSYTVAGNAGLFVTNTLHLWDGGLDYPTQTFVFKMPVVFSFTNTNRIVIRDNTNALAYPSLIQVAGVTGLVDRVEVSLLNLNHTYAPDVNVLVAGPTGRKTKLMGGAGAGIGSTEVHGNLIFSPLTIVTNPLPLEENIVPGQYNPTDYAPGVVFPSPAPASPYLVDLGTFNNNNPNGSWPLYVLDSQAGDQGEITGGWKLDITTITPIKKTAELVLFAAASPTSVLLNGDVRITFTITNAGPDTAGSVLFSNSLPSGVTVITPPILTNGVCINSNTALICTLSNMAPGVVTPITYVVRSSQAGPNTLSGVVRPLDVPTLNTSDDSAAAVFHVDLPVADVAVTQIAEPASGIVGHPMVFHITVANLGPETAYGAVLTNEIPENATFDAGGSSPGWVAIGGRFYLYAIGNMTNGAVRNVDLQVMPLVVGLATNTVVAFSASADPDPGNNVSQIVVPVNNPMPVILGVGSHMTSESLFPPNGAVNPGETVTIEFALTNSGTASTADLIAEIIPGGGVVVPGTPQSYGPMVPGGPSVTRAFTFTTDSAASGTVVVTLGLMDGVTNVGTVAFEFPIPTTTRAVSGTSGSALINIPDHGPASSYPSIITLSNLTGAISRVSLTLSNFTHSFPSDVGVMLVNPAGQKAMIMAGAGVGYAVTNLTLVFDDAATNGLLTEARIESGSYRPSNFKPGYVFPVPAPSGAAEASLSALNGTDPNGDWALYVVDMSVGDGGSIVNGWAIDVTTAVTVNPITDVGVTLSVPSSVFAADLMTVGLVVTNVGPLPANGVSAVYSLPPGVTFVSATSAQLLCYTNGTSVVCTNPGVLDVNAAATVSILLSPSGNMTMTNRAVVSLSEADLHWANNYASNITIVTIVSKPVLKGGFNPDNQFQIMLAGQVSQQYILQASTNLVNWLSIQTNSTGTDGQLKFTDTQSAGIPWRFYRAFRQAAP